MFLSVYVKLNEKLSKEKLLNYLEPENLVSVYLLVYYPILMVFTSWITTGLLLKNLENNNSSKKLIILFILLIKISSFFFYQHFLDFSNFVSTVNIYIMIFESISRIFFPSHFEKHYFFYWKCCNTYLICMHNIGG